MKPLFLPIALAAILTGCGAAPTSPAPVPKQVSTAPKITQFYSSPAAIPKGSSGSLCYGVEHATKVTLTPAVEEVWPSPSRCVQIRPDKETKYTLTAISADGQTDVKTVEVGSFAVPPSPRLFDLWVNAVQVGAGEQVKICFKTENADEVEISAGTLYKSAGCLTDYPKSTTTYKISAVGRNGQRDSGNITVKVR